MSSVARTVVILGLLGLGACSTVASSPPRLRRAGQTAVQALIGASHFHKLEFSRADPAVSTDLAEVDLATMPLLGVAGQHAIGGRRLEVGLDGGVVVGWEHDSARFISTASNAVVLLDRSLQVVDGFVGPYLSTIIADRVRLYGAAGASLMYGDAEYSDELLAERDTAFGVGVYARAGAEYRLVDRSFLGIGVRWVATELDFGDPIGDVDVEGWQGFLTYTIGF